MPNPLKGWQHRHQTPQPDKKTRIIPLDKAPHHDEDSGLYTVIFSRKIKRTPTKAPKVTGLWFSWDGSSYLCVRQESLADHKQVRELEYGHRDDDEPRLYVRAYLEKEEDELFAILRGIRKA